MNYWFVKSPFRTRSWQDVLVKGIFKLYGIRNHQSKNNISKMKSGDKALYCYNRQIYGITQVIRKAYPDPTTDNTDWLAIDFEPTKTFEMPIFLNQLRMIPMLAEAGFLKQPRVMVSPLTMETFEKISDIAIVEGKK